MADIATLVQKYLTTAEKPARLNLYTVLGLDELQDDRTTIALAVETAIEKLKAADRSSDAAGFEQVVKVVRQARSTLLDEEKKRTYDTQLKGTLKKVVSSSSESERPISDSIRLASLLPPGDPSAPFSMSEFLKTPLSKIEIETAAQRHIALAEIANPPSEPIPVSAPLTSPTGTNSGFGRPPAGKNAGRELQLMIQRNRQRKNLIASSIAVGASLVVVLIGVWMFISNRNEIARQTAMSNDGMALANAIKSTSGSPSNPPSVDGKTATQERVQNRMNLGMKSNEPKGKVGALPQIGGLEEPAMAAQEKPTAADPSSMEPAMVSPAKPDPKNPIPADPAAVPMKAPEGSGEAKMATMPAEGMEKKADPKKWREAMMDAKKAIESKNFEKFAVDIEKSLNLADGDKQEEQCRRLDKFGQLYQKGVEILNETIGELKPQDEIRYGSAGGRASVVEIKTNELILRISGKNETYTYDKLPLGIILAIMEKKMNDSPIDQAIRGIVCSTGPRNTAANKKQAKVFFEKAAAADPTLAKLDQILEENLQ